MCLHVIYFVLEGLVLQLFQIMQRSIITMVTFSRTQADRRRLSSSTELPLGGFGKGWEGEGSVGDKGEGEWKEGGGREQRL